MSTYRLPKVLGGVECRFFAKGYAPGCVIVELTEGVPGLRVEVDEDVLTPVPEEPPVGSVVLIDGEAAQRFEDNDLADNPDAHWASVGSPSRWTWVQICDLALPGGPLPMVLDPFEVPVALPWKHEDADGDIVEIKHDGGNLGVYVRTSATGVYLDASELRMLARAAWAAAGAVEGASDAA